jgi:hypothetical protein
MKLFSSRVSLRAVAALWLVMAGVVTLAVLGLLMSQPAQAAEVARPAQQFNQPDGFEPNDTAQTAKFLPPSGANLTFATLATTQTTSSAADDDWFLVTLDPNRSIVITTTSLAGANQGLLIVEGFSNPEGTAGAGTSSGQGNQSVLGIVNGTGMQQQYRVRVRNQLGQSNPTLFYAYRIDYLLNVTGAPTVTPIGANPDPYEDNETPIIAFNNRRSFVNVGSTLPNLNFYPNPGSGKAGTRNDGDVDWYYFYSRQGIRLRITTAVQPGVDTEMFLFDSSIQGTVAPDRPDINITSDGQIAYNDDYQPLDRGSQININTPYEGIYWLRIWNKDPTPRGAGQAYNLTVVEVSTLTPTVLVPPTPFPAGADRFEYNGDFDRASLIAPGVKVDQLNFVPFQPPSPDTVDNDFYRLPVKQGIPYTCETLDLSAGTDTNMIVYNANREGIGGNDDISLEERERGSFRSRFSWVAAYTGDYYLLIGEVNPPRANEGQSRSYSLLCNIGFPATPTPTVNPNPQPPTVPAPTLTPLPTATPFPTPRPPQPLVVVPVNISNARPTAQPTATPRVMVIEVQTFNDNNRNGQLDPGTNEGIAGTPVQLYDANTGTPLGQAFTDGDGRVRFSIINDGPVQVRVPTFGYSTIVDQPSATVRIALQPAVDVPERIP